VSFIADQRKVLFWKKALICDDMIVRIVANINRPYISMLLPKNSIASIKMQVGKIKNLVWRQFLDSAYTKENFYCFLCFICF